MTFDFKTLDTPIYSNDPWYDLTEGGYIKPNEILTDPEQIEDLNKAINMVKEFISQAESSETLLID